ncbi:MAG TPA: ubiquinol-cytochrome c reductase iron-sulfur subunit [Stellaceae bacterium]|jgi:ubiquinol-cytochrome c reductase iron-sulfur subunit|nr:ubiquinol-cytochrome c reductase iron-sulfur subunit [Stellaceae bacterium]
MSPESSVAIAPKTRRDVLTLSAYSLSAVGAATALWPFIDSMNPAADTRAEAFTEVDLAPIVEGQRVTVSWSGRPVFIAHRTPEEIAKAKAGDNEALRDPQKDTQRVKRPEWLVVIGICTHLGCVPGGQRPAEARGDWGGWYCPCHGSQYDTSARIRRGPAPRNLVVPNYRFLKQNAVRIG